MYVFFKVVWFIFSFLGIVMNVNDVIMNCGMSCFSFNFKCIVLDNFFKRKDKIFGIICYFCLVGCSIIIIIIIDLRVIKIVLIVFD